MKIFISYANSDKDIYSELMNELVKAGHTIFNTDDIGIGENMIEKIKSALNDANIFVALITENFLCSSWAQAELSSVVFSINEVQVLPVVIGDIFVPEFLKQFHYRKVNSREEAIKVILSDIEQLEDTKEETTLFLKKKIDIAAERDDLQNKISVLKNAFVDNQLTLVCGAGVSIGSSIPSWNTLLVNILNEAFFSDNELQKSERRISGEDLLNLMPQSNLILGKYLKLVLKNDFEKVVQKYLYATYNEKRAYEDQELMLAPELTPFNFDLGTSMMNAIVELARPRRDGRRLEAIITFNFDDLIENALLQHNVEHCSIWKEGQNCRIDELPIYHVHGFLPNREDVGETNLVFSEESYHSQFIDPYSWSNLIQLNKFSSNICLFIGLSLSDPNLRRLLDISWRRNQKCKHYIIMKKAAQTSKANKIATMLFEQDANALGLNVIWCSGFSEIPDILLKISM